MATCSNVCIHVNESSFKPLSMILFICGTLGSNSPLWAQVHLQIGPVYEQPLQNCCHLLGKWCLSPANQNDPKESILLVTFDLTKTKFLLLHFVIFFYKMIENYTEIDLNKDTVKLTSQEQTVTALWTLLMLKYLFGVHRDLIGVACLALFDLDLS